MRLDMTITLGNVLQICLTVGAIFIAYFKLREDLAVIKAQIGPLVDWWNTRAARRRGDEEE